MSTSKNPIERACGLLGSQSAIARLLKISAPTVNQWVKRTRPVPAAYCTLIERATNGQVTRQELRPDDYWLIWPDLPAPELAKQGEPTESVAEQGA